MFLKKVSISLLSNLHLTDFAKTKYKASKSIIYDISELRKVVLETIRQNLQKQAVVDRKKESA